MKSMKFEVGKYYKATDEFAIRIVAISEELSALKYEVIEIATGKKFESYSGVAEYYRYTEEENQPETLFCDIPKSFGRTQIDANDLFDMDEEIRRIEKKKEEERIAKEKAREEDYARFLEKVSHCGVTLKQLVKVLGTFVFSEDNIAISDWILEKIRQENQ